MKFPSFFGKKEKKQYFLSLLLRDEKVTAVILEELSGKIHVVGSHESYFNESIETANQEELLTVLDTAITQAETNLPKGIETQKTIFGVKENWVQDSKLKKEYLLKLKKTSDALGLLPIGFLVIHEAVAHLMQKEEGAPVSAVLVDIGKKELTISILRAGRIVETKKATIDDSISQTTDQLLHHFTEHEVLPSRIIILDNKKDTESLSQEFINHSWSKNLPFLHVPQTTILESSFEAKAILFGAATQMGFDVISSEEQTLADAVEGATENNFGFIREEDVIQKKQAEKKEDIIENIVEADEKEAADGGEKIKKIFLPILPLFTGLARIIKTYGHTPMFRKKIVFIPPLIIGGLLILLVTYVFFLGAKVTIIVNPKTIEKTENITFSLDSPTDIEQKIIGTTTISTSQDGTLSVPATGKKEVGEKAKGTVTIYSTLTKEQILTKGTILTANKLDFLLDETVKIASVSGASDEKKPIKASVIAKSIGKESNLPSGAKFSIGSFDTSEVEAKNESAFSGGTKKEVTVVSKADTDKLTIEIQKTISKKAKEEISKQAPQDTTLLPSIIESKLTKKDFNKDIGEEAETVTLTATVTNVGASYKNNDMKVLGDKILENDLKNMSKTQDGITNSVENIKQSGKQNITARLKVKASLIPKIDVKKLAQDLTGKSFEEAKNLLFKLQQVADIKVNLIPKLPFLPELLPQRKENIIIVVENE